MVDSPQKLAGDRRDCFVMSAGQDTETQCLRENKGKERIGWTFAFQGQLF
jgi:hypothetical protein